MLLIIIVIMLFVTIVLYRAKKSKLNTLFINNDIVTYIDISIPEQDKESAKNNLNKVNEKDS